jgi:exodeoxyribonuclease V alpha subunit
MQIEGFITKIIFSTECFCIFVLNGEHCVKTNKYVKLCQVNNYIKVNGIIIEHEQYGKQLHASDIMSMPVPQNMIYTYIKKKCEGVGEKTIAKLENKYGDNLLVEFSNNPGDIEKFINNGKIFNKLSEFFKNENVGADVEFQNFLYKLNIRKDIIEYLFNKYNISELKNVIDNDPYLLVKDGLELNSLDKFACGKFADSRVQAECYIELKKCFKSGSYYMKNTKKHTQFNMLDLKIFNSKITLEKYYNYEVYITQYITNLLKQNVQNIVFESDRFDIQLTTEQLSAIQMMLNHPVSILTGGPGTGKSTTIKYLVDILTDIYKPWEILLCALSGVATMNIKKIVARNDINSSTLHRSIYGEENCYKVIIIDELSLVDIKTFHHFLCKNTGIEKIIMVGDQNQIPSISPGQILRDLLKINKIPRVELTVIQRQQQNNSIIQNAYKIINGDADLIFDENCVKSELNLDQIKKSYETEQSIHVIALKRNTCNEINTYLQQNYNTGELLHIFGDIYFKLNDKVIQKVNNYKLGVFNGEIGYIADISFNEKNKCKITVDFADKSVDYENDDLLQIRLAYATTIHSSQGCEYGTVYIIMNDSSYLANRNVFYTAITRAKKNAIIIGNNIEFKNIIAKKYKKRITALIDHFN